MRIHVLGPVEGRGSDSRTIIDFGHAKQRCVLASLALRANQAMMIDDLVDQVWGAEPPDSARGILYSYVSRLRRALAREDDAPVLQRQSGGYLLQAAPEQIDVHRFRRLVARAREAEDAATASGLLRVALSCWNGRALAGIEGAWAKRTRDLLEIERASALVACHEAELRLGRHLELLDELQTLAAEQPLNELVIRNLIIALYRSGQQAEAIEQFSALRRRLADRLGVDPAPDTRKLFVKILRSDPTLGAPACAAGTAAPVPRQLPRDINLIGRDACLRSLDRLVDAAGDPARRRAAAVVSGPAGVGKTALALHWAHRVAHRFPDGQVFVDLHGGGPDGARGSGADSARTSPLGILRFVLWSLGTAHERIPAALEDCALAFQETAAGRRVLFVLDDATHPDQIEALLPVPPACAVVVTTKRPRLAEHLAAGGGPGVRLTELTETQSVAMLGRLLGSHRIQAEPRALNRIVEFCGGRPRSISAVAEQALGRPQLALADLASALDGRSRAPRDGCGLVRTAAT